MPRRNNNAQPTPRPSAIARMVLEDMEAGVDIHAPSVVVVGQPQAPRDRTIPAAPLGWTPEHDGPDAA